MEKLCLCTQQFLAVTAKSEGTNRERIPGNKSNSRYRILIISTGILVSISLLILIGRKIYNFLGIVQINGDQPSRSEASNVNDNVYYEIN